MLERMAAVSVLLITSHACSDVESDETDANANSTPDATPSCAPTVGGTIHVDPTLGTDDAMHGGGPGACAVETVDYALTVASAEVRLAATNYDRSQAAIVLALGQRLVCEEGASITGQGLEGTSNKAIRVNAPDTAVIGCTIVGQDEPGYCIDVTANDVTISNNVMTQCGGAPIRVIGNTGLNITGNTITSTAAVLPSIGFQGTSIATISNNVFSGGNWGISCNVACTLTGSGNAGGGSSGGCNPACGTCPSF